MNLINYGSKSGLLRNVTTFSRCLRIKKNKKYKKSIKEGFKLRYNLIPIWAYAWLGSHISKCFNNCFGE